MRMFQQRRSINLKTVIVGHRGRQEDAEVVVDADDSSENTKGLIIIATSHPRKKCISANTLIPRHPNRLLRNQSARKAMRGLMQK